MSLESLLRGIPAAFGAALLGFACQSIADIPETVTFSRECRDYCDEVMTQCKDLGLMQYPSEDACLVACQSIGQASNFENKATGNNVICRTLKAAQVPALGGEEQDFCSKAGPGGGGGADACTSVSGSAAYCEGYCSLYLSACKGKSTNPFDAAPKITGIPKVDEIADRKHCLDACAAVPPIPGPGYYSFDESDQGNTIACRLHYATLAGLDPSEENCIRAGIRPQANCEDRKINCRDFCRAARVACPGHYDAGAAGDERHCIKTCEATDAEKVLKPGEKAEPETQIAGPDTQYCRNTHVFVALFKHPEHCAHAGVLGSGVCGSNCDAYCRLAKKACGTGYKDAFGEGEAGDQACAEKCKDLKGAGSSEHHPVDPQDYTVEGAEKSGNSVQCRALYASRALDEEGLSVEKKAEFCDAAFGRGACSGG